MSTRNVHGWLGRTVLRITTRPVVASLLLAAASACLAAESRAAGSDEAWVPAMKAVHAKFKGERGTCAHFGDSITVSRAFWCGLKYAPQNVSPEMTRALGLVKGYLLEDCWDWKGPEYGNEGRMTIRWAHQNVDRWLKEPDLRLLRGRLRLSDGLSV